MALIPATLPQLAGGQPDALGLLRRLESGVTLSGRVLRPGPQGTTPIQVGSAILQLLVQGTPPEPGTLVQVRSEGGKILIDPKPQPGGQTVGDVAAKAPSPSQSRSILSTLTQSSPVLARVLQAHNLPVQLETIQLLQSVVGNLAPEQGPLFAFLLARNIPITAENLIQIRQRLRARGNLGRELANLVSEGQALLETGAVRGSEGLARVLVDLRTLLTWNPSGDLSERILQIRSFLTTLEEKLVGGQGALAKSDFKGLLLELDHLLGLADLDENHPLRAAARKTLHLLEGAQLSALTQTPLPDKEAWVFWRLPFPGDPHPTTVELAVRGERDPDDPDRLDPKNMEALIQVDLSVLGTVRIHARVSPDDLRLMLTVTEPSFHQMIEKEAPVLQKALTEAGYPNAHTDVRVEAIAEGSLADLIDPLKGWEKDLESSPSRGLDIRL